MQRWRSMNISRLPHSSLLAIALIFLACSCSRAPESYPPPVQVMLPPRPEPAVVLPVSRLALAMSDPDIDTHVLRDVYAELHATEWRFTGLHPAFRFDFDERHNLDFYIRLLIGDDSLLARGPVEFTVNINGHRFRSYRFSYPGDTEYRHPVPDDWIAVAGPIDISLDINPPWRLPDGTVYGLFLNSIGFARRSK